MPLSPGTRLGPYEIVSPLGAGGMGEVWRAVDSRLGRPVAIKVLPPGYAADADRMKRFEREARATSSLNHPGIVTIHDVGTVDSTSYIAMELVEGKTVRELLTGDALPPRRALEIAAQVAAGLAAAHEAAIVHRDLKPENIMVRGDGIVKILDFGLAKLTSRESDSDATSMQTASAATGAGVVLGTVGYMSPEQACGERADFRSDQFALGAILYEMLTGRKAFVKATAPETLAAIIRDEPEPIAALSPRVPAPLRWITERCLSKEPAKRYASTSDLAGDLKTLSERLTEVTGTGGLTPASRGRPGTLRLAVAGLALSLLAAVTSASLLVRERRRPDPAPVRFEVHLPEGFGLSPYRNSVALSPDGRLLAYAALPRDAPNLAAARLFLRPLETAEARPVTGTEGAQQPLFSPDSRHLAFYVWSEGLRLKRVPITGGTAETICECRPHFGAVWSPDGWIYFAAGGGPIQRVPAAGGTAEPVTTLDTAAAEVSHRLPGVLPDGTLLYTALRWSEVKMTWEKARIHAFRPGAKGPSLLVEGGSDGRWAPPGALVFAQQGKLMAAPLDSSTLRLTAKPAPLVEGVRHSIWTGVSGIETGAAHLSTSPAGPLAWAPGSVDPPYVARKVWVDAKGVETPLEAKLEDGPFDNGRVSPDGRRVLVTYDRPGRQAEIVDLERRAVRRATFGANPTYAIWGPGPDRITFASDHEGPLGLYVRRLDAGPDEIERLWQQSGVFVALGSWSRDGKVLAFVEWSSSADILLLEKGKPARPFLATRFNEGHPDISPDGQWLVYTSNESGRSEVFVRAISGVGGAQQVSTGEAHEPLWSRDGASIFYWHHVEGAPDVQAIFRVRVSGTPQGLLVGVPERLFERPNPIWNNPGHSWDVAPDGRFLLTRVVETASRWDQRLSKRIVVDTGGVARLLDAAETGR